MHLLSHAIANDPQSAVVLGLVAALVPAIVEQTVLAGLFVVKDVGMFARNGAVDRVVFGEARSLRRERPSAL